MSVEYACQSACRIIAYDSLKLSITRSPNSQHMIMKANSQKTDAIDDVKSAQLNTLCDYKEIMIFEIEIYQNQAF